MVITLVLGASLAAAWLAVAYRQALPGLGRLIGVQRPSPETTPPGPATPPPGPWDGRVRIGEGAVQAIGLRTEPARPQERPIKLELLGKTAYRTNEVTRVRPLFKGRADRVHVTACQSVKPGDPRVDLYSVELTQAKSDYEIKRMHRDYDEALLKVYQSLVGSSAVSRRVYEEARRDAMRSRLECRVARDKLRVYGLSDAEIESVTAEDGAQKARLTLRSPAGGVVVSRDVVTGNLYDENDVLLVISPLDRLWVWGNAFESDLDLLKLGLTWEILFPYLNLELDGSVEYIADRVDPETHAVRVRTSVPNRDGRLKADMLVRGMLEIPAVPGRVVIPRPALLVVDGGDYVFVVADDDRHTFERRAVRVVQEQDDHAVIGEGIRPGEPVVAVGALVLAQHYENLRRADSAGPESRGRDR